MKVEAISAGALAKPGLCLVTHSGQNLLIGGDCPVVDDVVMWPPVCTAAQCEAVHLQFWSQGSLENGIGLFGLLPQVRQFKCLRVLFISEGKMAHEISRRCSIEAMVVAGSWVWRWRSQLTSQFIFQLPPVVLVWVTERQRIKVAEISFLPSVAGPTPWETDILRELPELDGSLQRHFRHVQPGGALWQTRKTLEGSCLTKEDIKILHGELEDMGGERDVRATLLWVAMPAG